MNVIAVDEREFILVGTAHVSRESADLVRTVIETERPDRVCLELDSRRFEALSEKKRFESLDLKEIIRRRQLSTLILNLLLASYQQRIGGQLGVLPGTELLEGARVAEECGIPVSLCDRDVRATLRRAWAALSLWQKIQLFASILERPKITEETLREFRQQDTVSKFMQELGATFPALKTVLIDERDAYLARKMKQESGERVVAVVGAGHVEGIRAALLERRPADLAALEAIPPVSAVWKWLGWGIPVLIIGALAAIGVERGAAAAGNNLVFWILVHSVPSLLGALLAFGHPATVLVAAVVAPFTSLTPVIGAGYVAAFVQTYFRPPRVHELHSVAREFNSPRRWWKNRLLRILLVFLLVTLGSAFGTIVGGAKIFANLF